MDLFGLNNQLIYLFLKSLLKLTPFFKLIYIKFNIRIFLFKEIGKILSFSLKKILFFFLYIIFFISLFERYKY